MNAISTASTSPMAIVDGRHASNVLPLTPIRALLGIQALRALLDVSTTLLIDETVWLLGDDRSTILSVHSDLGLLVGIVESGLREDDAIATEATRLARILQNRFRRDQAAGLCLGADHEVQGLAFPDLHATH